MRVRQIDGPEFAAQVTRALRALQRMVIFTERSGGEDAVRNTGDRNKGARR